jgi:hypothetical protein
MNGKHTACRHLQFRKFHKDRNALALLIHREVAKNATLALSLDVAYLRHRQWKDILWLDEASSFRMILYIYQQHRKQVVTGRWGAPRIGASSSIDSLYQRCLHFKVSVNCFRKVLCDNNEVSATVHCTTIVKLKQFLYELFFWKVFHDWWSVHILHETVHVSEKKFLCEL